MFSRAFLTAANPRLDPAQPAAAPASLLKSMIVLQIRHQDADDAAILILHCLSYSSTDDRQPATELWLSRAAIVDNMSNDCVFFFEPVGQQLAAQAHQDTYRETPRFLSAFLLFFLWLLNVLSCDLHIHRQEPL